MKVFSRWFYMAICIILVCHDAKAQQMKLGNNPFSMHKSAVLELNSTNQGLLLVRISDTTQINLMAPPDGMIIYFTPTKQLYTRSNGFWKALTYAESVQPSWSLKGNTGINAATDFVGTRDDNAIVFKSNNSSFLEIGRRQTLGLTQSGYTDYTDNNEQVTLLKSALQFHAPAAEFYKPKMFVDGNGNFRIKGSAAGTDYFELGSTGTSNNGGFEFIVGDDGNEPIVFKSYHYQTGMSEMMRLQSGRMAVGSNAFDASNPEKLLIDAGTTSSFNLMTGKGSIDNYLQINVQNRSNGGTASSDFVATSDNGSETANFVNMGINSSGFNNTSYPVISGANNAYLYSTGNDFVIGNASSSRALRFFAGGFATTNERLRISNTGLVGIGTQAPTTQLHVRTGVASDGGLRLENLTNTSTLTADAAAIGVDATGKVVRVKTPTYYSGTGSSAAVNEVTKIWTAELSNTNTGIISVTIPANVGFANILDIQVTAKGGSTVLNFPVATVVSNTTSVINVRVLESKTSAILVGGTTEGLEEHKDTNTKVFVRVEGN